MKISSPKLSQLNDSSIGQVIILAFLLCYVLLVYSGIVITERDAIFDDSFITYRYANNLASGYGITWNPGEQPVEGYTNFLLVVLLAPFIKWGLSPLWVTRVLSLVAALGIALLLLNVSKRDYGATGASVWIAPVTFLLATQTALLSTVGLETVIYTGVLSLTFIIGCRFFSAERKIDLLLFGLLAFVAFLLRPEALLVVASFCLVALAVAWKDGTTWRLMRLLTVTLFLSLGFPLIVYLLWKYAHFGSIVPNPFFIKMADSQRSLFATSGLVSILDFLVFHSPLIFTALFSYTLTNNHNKERLFAVLTGLLFGAFFLRVDTLMDIYGRFLYPMAFILVYLSVPTLVRGAQHVLSMQWSNLVKVPFTLVLCLSLIGVSTAYQTLVNYGEIIRGDNKYANSDSLMQKEYQVAAALSRYQHIKEVRIAFGDAGVIPYLTGALHLDVVGLNDRFIARERDLEKLTDYFFGQRPDLIMHPANKDHSWITYGHGPLGDYSRWSLDSRWDEYSYVGTIKTSGTLYDIHVFLRRDMLRYDQLRTYLLESVVDGFYDLFPIPIGTHMPDTTIPSTWTPTPGT